MNHGSRNKSKSVQVRRITATTKILPDQFVLSSQTCFRNTPDLCDSFIYATSSWIRDLDCFSVIRSKVFQIGKIYSHGISRLNKNFLSHQWHSYFGRIEVL